MFNKLFFYQIGPVIDPKMRSLQEIKGFLFKIIYLIHYDRDYPQYYYFLNI